MSEINPSQSNAPAIDLRTDIDLSNAVISAYVLLGFHGNDAFPPSSQHQEGSTTKFKSTIEAPFREKNNKQYPLRYRFPLELEQEELLTFLEFA